MLLVNSSVMTSAKEMLRLVTRLVLRYTETLASSSLSLSKLLTLDEDSESLSLIAVDDYAWDEMK
jgi:hypothetical protein